LLEPDKNAAANAGKVSYTVTGPHVYFHNQPDESTRRNAFINRWNKAVLKPLDEKNGFVYIVYTNQWGQTSKGWMLKKHLTPLDEAAN
jgi:serine/threonine-protein kinase